MLAYLYALTLEEVKYRLPSILESYLHTTVTIARSVNGKPYISSPETNLKFNLSHSQNQAVLAILQGEPIGIDIEVTTTHKPKI